jgi:hypothetical protein
LALLVERSLSVVRRLFRWRVYYGWFGTQTSRTPELSCRFSRQLNLRSFRSAVSSDAENSHLINGRSLKNPLYKLLLRSIYRIRRSRSSGIPARAYEYVRWQPPQAARPPTDDRQQPRQTGLLKEDNFVDLHIRTSYNKWQRHSPCLSRPG